ncbi:MAG TPA: hypothetical protein VFE71_08030, partial [Bacteroidales bacterium]|nr:hypothetical protein [Bacteroidales bacterium]
MNITYKFILQGQSYIIPEKKDEVVLDVGGQNQGFIFDHHFPNSPEDCAAKIVFNNSNRLKELKDSKNVTIVIHNDPDFDCSCAAWLVKNYLEENCSNGRLFPKDAEWVVQYASLVDSGKLKINSKHVLTPATAIFAFYELSLKKIKDREIDANDKNEWILYRTFDLLNWCVNKLTDINIDNYENIDDKSISDRMIQSEKFGMEHQILEEDRPIFESELLDKSICQTIKDFKLFNHQKTVEKVSALIYFRPSRSSLVKYWARNDGYIFTLIPKNCDGKWDNAIWKPPGFSGRPNRVIISVPPDSNYNLKTLAIQ